MVILEILWVNRVMSGVLEGKNFTLEGSTAAHGHSNARCVGFMAERGKLLGFGSLRDTITNTFLPACYARYSLIQAMGPRISLEARGTPLLRI